MSVLSFAYVYMLTIFSDTFLVKLVNKESESYSSLSSQLRECQHLKKKIIMSSTSATFKKETKQLCCSVIKLACNNTTFRYSVGQCCISEWAEHCQTAVFQYVIRQTSIHDEDPAIVPLSLSVMIMHRARARDGAKATSLATEWKWIPFVWLSSKTLLSLHDQCWFQNSEVFPERHDFFFQYVFK